MQVTCINSILLCTHLMHAAVCGVVSVPKKKVIVQKVEDQHPDQCFV